MDKFSTITKAIGNPVRLKLINCLSVKDSTVSELISNCGLAQSAVSQHLTLLKDSGIVSCSKEGREVIYHLDQKEISNVFNIVNKLSKE